MEAPQISGPVLVLAPQGRDGSVASAILREACLSSIVCNDLEELIRLLPNAESAVIAEEALTGGARTRLATWMADQPAWSDFPLVLLSFRDSAVDPALIELLGNVTVLERPFHPSILVSSVRSAGRARKRQRQVELYLKELQRAEEQRELLLRELHHRVKNTFATIEALLRATSRSSTSVDDFAEALSERIHSLSKTNELLVGREWKDVSLHDILNGELAPFEGASERVVLDGPRVDLIPELALPIGMAIHELTTNAAKYGSLSILQGRLSVSWEVRPAPSGRKLHLIWTERDGPAVSPPSRKGFGSTLIERVLSHQCGAETTYEFAESGLTLRIELPLDSAQPQNAAA